jgi:phycocyanobilin:ferredoxin oxidoreductase
MQNDLVQDIALLLSYTMQDFPDVEKMVSPIPEVSKDGISIKNTMYKTPVLRKMHLELAEINNMRILHCVLFPDVHYKLPIFGCDIVANEKTVTAAIVDLSPVHGIPETFYNSIRDISNKVSFSGKRPLPLWGDEIFSPYCKFASLKEEEDMANFYCIVLHYLNLYRQAVLDAKRDTFWVDVMKRIDDQTWYCKSQKKNDKTRGILKSWFDEEFADMYMNEVLFDEPNIKSIPSPSFEGPY